MINEIAYVKNEDEEEDKDCVQVANEDRGIGVAPMMPVVEIPRDLASAHMSACESTREESIDDPSMSARESTQKSINNVQDAGGEDTNAAAFAGHAQPDDKIADVGSCEFASRSTRAHQDHVNHAAVEQHIKVHTPIPIGKVLQISKH